MISQTKFCVTFIVFLDVFLTFIIKPLMTCMTSGFLCLGQKEEVHDAIKTILTL